jgi:hypothetical protein
MNNKTKKKNNTAKFSYLFLFDLNMTNLEKYLFSNNMEKKKRKKLEKKFNSK